MTDVETQATTPHRYATPRQFRPKVRPKWPVVIGSIIIALSTVGLGARIASGALMASVGRVPIGTIIGALMDVIPLAAGILLIQRKPQGRTLLKLVAWINIFLSPVLVIVLVALLNEGILSGALGYGVLGYSGIILGFYLFSLWWVSRRATRGDLNGW